MEVTRIFDILNLYRTKYKYHTKVFGAKINGKWEKYTAKDYLHYSNGFSYGLLEMGYKKGDKIATVSNNRPEWNFVDMGMLQVGCVHVPVYPTISDEEYLHILKHSDAKMIIVSDEKMYAKIQPIAQKLDFVPEIYTFDHVEGAKHWSEITELGRKAENYLMRGKTQNRRDEISENDLATIIYTSGTTGLPKGVMLSHKNFIYQIQYIKKIVPLKVKDRCLSFLPLCHVLERIGGYTFQFMGLSIFYAESVDKIAENIQEVKPHVFVTVPRLLERVYDKIIAKGKDLEGMKKKLFFSAVEAGLAYQASGKKLSYSAKLAVYNAVVFSKWREALGGSVKAIISGGAALQERLAKVFRAAQLPVYEGYGLSETAPVICVNHPRSFMFGTVGPILGREQEVKIASDGEILFKGPNLMLGYYKNSEKTKEVIDDNGWFHTGDIGKFIDGTYLKITDRKKEIFKLSTGKYVAPQVVENIMKESFFIEQLIVIGENEKYTSAIIAPNYEFLHDWCHKKHINFQENEDLIENEQVIKRYEKEVEEFNKRLGKTEQIKRFALVAQQFSEATGELSPTQKLKRRFIKQKYQTLIAGLYDKF